MTRILTIIALLCATPAWAGEVDGKAFLCNPNGLRTSVSIAVELQHGLATIYSEFYGQQPSKYDAFDSWVGWEVNVFGFHYNLNRKSLVLIYIGPSGSPVSKWQCEFMEIVMARKKVAESEANRKRKAREGNQF
jgi:hypothetical protein